MCTLKYFDRRIMLVARNQLIEQPVDPREPLFKLNNKMNEMMPLTIVDLGSQNNLIVELLVSQHKLETPLLLLGTKLERC
jgi:hypothetical protein